MAIRKRLANIFLCLVFTMYRDSRWHLNLNIMVISSFFVVFVTYVHFSDALWIIYAIEEMFFLLEAVHQLTIVLRKRSLYLQRLRPLSHPHMKLPFSVCFLFCGFFFFLRMIRISDKVLKILTYPMNADKNRWKQFLAVIMWLNNQYFWKKRPALSGSYQKPWHSA